MTTTTIVTPVGLEYVQLLLLNDNGSPAASGTSEYAGLRVSGAKAFSLNLPEPEIVRQTGDNKVFTSFVLPPAENATAELNTGKMNLTVDALLTDVDVVALGDMQMLAYATDKQGEEPFVCLLAYSLAHNTDPDSADFNEDVYRYYLIPRAQVIPRLAPAEERAVSDHMYTVDIKRVTKYPWELAFVLGTDGCTEAEIIAGVSPARPRLVAFLGDGTETEFSFGKNARATDNIHVYVDGVLQSTGITLAVGNVTFDTAPTSGKRIVVFYDTEVE